jgi:pimeloyl-ACP methyl ester carboxylesterase
MIRLHVAIFHSTNPTHAPDPVIQLSGGPGSGATDLVWYHFQQGADRFLDDRDFIFFDQRGTGHSEPTLKCPEREDASVTLLTQDLTLEQQSQLELQSMQACHDRLIAEGVDLTAYNSAASAADINDLRVALGYQQINLFGVSYGTRLALTVMRDNPGILRSVILDSVYPPQFNLYTSLAPDTQRALDVLFSSCANDASCSSTFPDLEAVFYQMVDALNASPMQVPITEPNTKQQISVVLNGDLLVDLTATAIYRPLYEGKIPRMIYDLQRSYANPFLESRLELYFDRSASRGMTFSVQCHEEIPFDSLDEMIAEASNAKPQVAHNYVIRLEILFQLCDMWGAGLGDAAENQPVTSSIPTLIYAGRYDPITPPAWGQIAGETLDHSYYYEFPEGHWVMRSDSRCPVEMAAAFLNNPANAPDGSCIAGMSEIPFAP